MKWLLAMVLCAFATPALAQDSIKIAVTGPFTGGSAPMGISARDGAKLAIAEINAAGGIQVGAKKLKIEAIERDDEAKNERGALIGQELAAMSDLSGVIGSVNTGVVLAGDKYLQEKGITRIITPAAGSASMTQWAKPDGPKDLFMFRFAAHDGIQAAMVVEEAIARKFTKVAIFADATNYGVSGHDLSTRSRSRAESLEVATEKWAIGDKDMSAQLLKAKALGAQAILIWGIGPELAAIANGRSLGSRPR
jgi:branched-chain amino acid transport system substrate-binding protein